MGIKIFEHSNSEKVCSLLLKVSKEVNESNKKLINEFMDYLEF